MLNFLAFLSTSSACHLYHLPNSSLWLSCFKGIIFFEAVILFPTPAWDIRLWMLTYLNLIYNMICPLIWALWSLVFKFILKLRVWRFTTNSENFHQFIDSFQGFPLIQSTAGYSYEYCFHFTNSIFSNVKFIPFQIPARKANQSLQFH